MTLEKGYRYFVILNRKDETPAAVAQDVCVERKERACLSQAAVAPTRALRLERERACKSFLRMRSPCGPPLVPSLQFLIKMLKGRPTTEEEERIAQRYTIPDEEMFVYDAVYVRRELRRKYDLD